MSTLSKMIHNSTIDSKTTNPSHKSRVPPSAGHSSLEVLEGTLLRRMLAMDVRSPSPQVLAHHEAHSPQFSMSALIPLLHLAQRRSSMPLSGKSKCPCGCGWVCACGGCHCQQGFISRMSEDGSSLRVNSPSFRCDHRNPKNQNFYGEGAPKRSPPPTLYRVLTHVGTAKSLPLFFETKFSHPLSQYVVVSDVGECCACILLTDVFIQITLPIKRFICNTVYNRFINIGRKSYSNISHDCVISRCFLVCIIAAFMVFLSAFQIFVW